MSEMAGFGAGSWLPPRVARVMRAEDGHDRAEARREAIERADREAQRMDQALGAAVAAAEARGEHVSAQQLVTGAGLGRTPGEIMRSAFAAMDRADALAEHRERRGAGDWEYLDAPPEPRLPVSRSAIVNEYELDRAVTQLEDGRTWMAHYEMELASRRGRAQEHIEAKRAQVEARRSQPTSTLTAYTEIVR
jgi:hypothetical protein